MLNKLEHYLLSITLDDIEPFYILYGQTMKEIDGATQKDIIRAVVKLTNEGLVSCSFSAYAKETRPCPKITVKKLSEHCRGRSESALREYPDPPLGEYKFEGTLKGIIEEDREIYAIYYIDYVKENILYLSMQEKKPLHLILSDLIDANFLPGALIEGKWDVKVIDAIPILSELLKDGLLECYFHSGQTGEEYHRLANLKEEDMLEYINVHRRHKFSRQPFPEEGGEYYFKTTDAGRHVIEDNLAS